jgi:hypothetical protein
VDLAPGPCVRGRASLDVLTDEGQIIFSKRIRGREVMIIPVPAGAVRLRLHVNGGGHRIEADVRPLNLCVRRCAFRSPAALYAPWDAALRIWRALGRKVLLLFLPGPKYIENGPDFLHLTAAGDFTMLAREHWFDLRAYPEFAMFPMAIDSLFCYTAHYGGAKEYILESPMRAYHIEHDAGSGWTPEGQDKLFERLTEKGVPWLDPFDMLRWGFDMSRTNSPMIFNRDDWGLASEQLKETALQRPA